MAAGAPWNPSLYQRGKAAAPPAPAPTLPVHQRVTLQSFWSQQSLLIFKVVFNVLEYIFFLLKKQQFPPWTV